MCALVNLATNRDGLAQARLRFFQFIERPKGFPEVVQPGCQIRMLRRKLLSADGDDFAQMRSKKLIQTKKLSLLK